ncbi:flagellar hook-length control protein [Noviherbaspirillum cavernae]|uniref:flagellar hook-length control protein n=1 Tax=Noviherbaspirillum cavernae TaxID=2320862 RepID=UPI0013140183|nr:flagellar hook-length control protein [Noviherbaspirillum cavernae]
MSIAVSVVVKPSRLLLILVGGVCASVIAAGSMISLGVIGNLSALPRGVIAVFSFFPALFGFYHTVQNRKAIHIDISGIGQVRLKELSASIGSCQEPNWPHVNSSVPVRLLQDSTLWSQLLLLRLQTDNGTVVVVSILPDCVSRDEFRALSVACRWIAAHKSSADQKKA